MPQPWFVSHYNCSEDCFEAVNDRTKSVLYRTKSVLYRSKSVLYRSKSILYRINFILYRTNFVLCRTSLFYTESSSEQQNEHLTVLKCGTFRSSEQLWCLTNHFTFRCVSTRAEAIGIFFFSKLKSFN